MFKKIIPTPKNINLTNNDISFDATICPATCFAPAIEAFIDYAARTGINFATESNGTITVNKDDSLKNGEYKIIINNEGINLYAADLPGMNHAFASVLQLINKADAPQKFSLPEGTIHDCPDNWYRGLMVDLARAWHGYDYLLRYVDMCYFYKVAFLQLHFTDDQSYTLPSDLFPGLPTKDRHYTKEQIAKLSEYATARGVMIIPEIDVPGHCTSFKIAYPELFGTNGLICQHEDSMKAMKNLFGELCDMFPDSKYIHIGGDEAAIANWTTCEKCNEYIASKGIDVTIENKRLLSEMMLANFVSEMADAVFAKGRTPIVWEGFAKEVNHMVSRDIIVMSWENFYQTTPSLLEEGFNIINCAWKPMYIVAPVIIRSTQDVYDWTVNKWRAVHPESPYLNETYEATPTKAILGGQLLAWGDQLTRAYPSVRESIADESRLIQERIPYLAQNTWNTNKVMSYEEFAGANEPINGKLEKLLAQWSTDNK